MAVNVKLHPKECRYLHSVDERLVSYNVEMTEVTGGTFWKAYTPGQIAGTEAFSPDEGFREFTSAQKLMQHYPPIDLENWRLRTLAKALGPAWVRVSGTWATKTYYDFEGGTNGKAPEGYASVLTRDQWVKVLGFVKDVGGKLLISISNCEGDHPGGGPLDLSQAKKIFDFSHAYGVDINAAEFMNEPNMLEMSGAPKGYTSSDYRRDQDIFFSWLRENYPDCLRVGPCSLGEGALGKEDFRNADTGMGSLMEMLSTHDLMEGTQVPLDVFSYHYYNGVSERLASILPKGHWDTTEAHSDAYLAVASSNAETYKPLRDKYVPGGQMWVTESGDAGGGGNTWASTYLDVFRTLNELGSFSRITDGIVFHNTLASSDYGFLQHGSFEPRPNYFAVLLWNRLMGRQVYDCGDSGVEGAHVYCHSRKDGEEGYAYLIINNSLSENALVELPKPANVFILYSDHLRGNTIKLNGQNLRSTEELPLPDLAPMKCAGGEIPLPPASCTFVVL